MMTRQLLNCTQCNAQALAGADATMMPLSPTDSLIQAAGRWFLESGIQEANGGVARYYRSDLGRNAPISTEITGYAVSALLFFFDRTGDGAYRDAALRAARFLTRVAWDAETGAFPFELVSGGAEPAFAYFFDCGIIARGLLSAWRSTRDVEFRDAAIAAGRSLLADFSCAGGWSPILALPSKRALEWEPRWSASPGCYQLKSALAWHELFALTGESAFQSAYEQALEAALANDREFLPGESERLRVMDRLHAYGYFLEGLLPVLDRPDCAAAFRTGVDRLSRHLREIAPVFARSDVYAQLLRARLFGAVSGILPLDQESAGEEASHAAAFQTPSGGFLFGCKQGGPMPFVNPVSTAFCAQALAMWDDRRANRPIIPPQALI